jgi:hypothetical protein
MNIVAQYISTFTFRTNNTGILYEHLRWEWYFAATSGRTFKPASWCGRLRLKCDCTCAETRFRCSAKRTSPFKSAGASVQSTTGSRGVRISGSNAGYTMFRCSVKGTGYPLYSPVSRLHPPHVSPCAITFQLDSNISVYSNQFLLTIGSTLVAISTIYIYF